MSIFNGYNTIQEYLGQEEKIIEATINQYDYRQLRDDFGDLEIGNLVSKFSEPIIEIENKVVPKASQYETRDMYNRMFDYSNFQPEYIKVKGKSVDCEIPLESGKEFINLGIYEDTLTRVFNNNRLYEDMEFSNEDCAIKFTVFIPDSDTKGKTREEISALFNKTSSEYLSSVSDRIGKLNQYIIEYNSNLQSTIRKIIATKIEKDSSMDLFSEAIGVSIASKNGCQEKGKPICITPAKIDIDLPERKKYEGYYLEEKDYSAIITTIRNHLVATENLPKAIQKLDDEELIRDTILWSLNANYIIATGETFRGQGKTDICINFKERSAFVAECKIWRGEKYVNDAIDQLLSYTTWRDSKAAIIVFNLGKQDFKNLCDDLRQIAERHFGFQRTTSLKSQNEFECTF